MLISCNKACDAFYSNEEILVVAIYNVCLSYVPILLVTNFHPDCFITLHLQGTLRVLLVLLHDFPEFLCDYHFSFCDVIPPNCIQMRNLILSAFPRNMRLPDPFTPNLKVSEDSSLAMFVQNPSTVSESVLSLLYV